MQVVSTKSLPYSIGIKPTDILIDTRILSGLASIREPEPDVAVVKFSPDYYSSNHPSAKDILLVIEVSDSSLEYDRENKASTLRLRENSGMLDYKPSKRKSKLTILPLKPI